MNNGRVCWVISWIQDPGWNDVKGHVIFIPCSCISQELSNLLLQPYGKAWGYTVMHVYLCMPDMCTAASYMCISSTSTQYILILITWSVVSTFWFHPQLWEVFLIGHNYENWQWLHGERRLRSCYRSMWKTSWVACEFFVPYRTLLVYLS